MATPPDIRYRPGPMVMPLLVVAGEASADAHAAAVLRALVAQKTPLAPFGVGGRACRAAGMEVVVPAEHIALAGLTEVVTALPRLWWTLGRLTRLAKQRGVRTALLLDLPDFNLRLAKRLKRAGIRVIYYISPQVWAWRSARVNTIRQVVDEMLVILPFEEAYYRARQVPARFVGHPLVEALAPSGTASDIKTRAEARAALGGPGQGPGKPLPGTDAAAPWLALLPGSRRREVDRLLPPMLDAVVQLQKRWPNLRVLLPVASTICPRRVARWVAQRGLDVQLTDGRSDEVLRAADAAVICSGTATLEAALHQRPMVVVYKTSRLTFAVLKRLVRLRHIALVNLVAPRPLVPELLQGQVHGCAIAEALALQLGPARKRLETNLARLRARLSEQRPAEEVARAVLASLDSALAKEGA